MIEAVRINIRSERDAELVIGRILAYVNRDDKIRNVEILEGYRIVQSLRFSKKDHNGHAIRIPKILI